MSGKLFSFCDAGTQGGLKAAKDLVAGMLHGYAPKLNGSSTTFLQSVWARLQWFAEYAVPGKAG
eukprot:7209731-Alexandrium_andersonii.AAC.1